MTTHRSINLRFSLAALLASAGCYALWHNSTLATVCFGLMPMLTLPGSKQNQTIPHRQGLLIIVGTLVFAIALLVYFLWVSPPAVPGIHRTTSEDSARHPVLALSFWVVMLWSLNRVFQKRKAEAAAGLPPRSESGT